MPPDMMAIRVAIDSASSWSWVTKTKVVPDLAVDPGQLGLHLLAELEVEGPERLVEQEHRRPLGQGSGQGDPLLLPARHLGRAGDRPGRAARRARGTRRSALVMSAFDSFSIRRPNATFSATVMCGNRA